MSIELSPEELARFTRKRHTDAQARVLDELGIPYVPHPTEPGLLVARKAVESRLMAQPASRRDEAVPQVDVAAIRGFHGKASRGRRG